MNQFLDTLIGMHTQLKAVDIAVLMGKYNIRNILEGGELTGVRCGRTIACSVG